MQELTKNYYGSLCTEMYEILHEKAPEDELAFYLSYAVKGGKILEPLCGSGRFLVPFMERGFDIQGVDMSEEMLGKLKEKAPGVRVICGDMTSFTCEEKYDYIFISSGSVSLFTDMNMCKAVLRQIRALLAPGGKFVFAVDTLADRVQESTEYGTALSVKTKEGLDLVMKGKNHFDESTQTQYSPSIYELYKDGELLCKEPMDFQTHLYRLGEMEQYLKEAGFSDIAVYGSFDKKAADEQSEMFLYECY